MLQPFTSPSSPKSKIKMLIMENGNRKNSTQKLLFLEQFITSVLNRLLVNLKRMVQSNALF
jgi:hypothetical protein